MTAAAEKAALAIVQDAAARHGATLDAVPARDRKHLRDRLLSLDGLADLPPVRPLIDGLLYKDTLAQLAGAPGSYKSFITVGMACAVAVGVNWEGHRVPEAGPVVYVAAEGASGLRVRILAWCEANKVPVERVARNLRVLREPLALVDEQDVQEAVEVASESGALLTVLDTRARCTTGLEENSATEQGHAIAAAERIQRASGGAVLLVHHTGRNGEHGRGSNSWDGAVWSDLRLQGAERRCTVKCEKHKDVPDGCEHNFRLLPRVVSADLMPPLHEESPHDHVARRSTLVVVQNDLWTNEEDDSRSSGKVLDIIRTKAGAEGLTRAEVVRLSEDAQVSRSTAYEVLNALVSRGALRNVGSEKRHKYVVAGPVLVSPEE